jgi:glycosyltransferase involved in cell wall biosynthesis
MKISLVVPCYNEQDNVVEFYNQVKSVFLNKVDDYEFVFVDDGSSDKTYERLSDLYSTHPESNIQVLSFSRNFGKESAIYAGLSKSKGDLACIIDADLQQRPEVVLQMLDIIENNDDLDCVAAYQEVRKESKLMSSVKSFFYKIINKMAEIDFVDGASDFRLMRRNVVDSLLSMTEFHRFSKGLFSWVGFNTEYIPYQADERLTGTTKWSTGKLIKYALEGIFAFSTVPLKFSTYVGLFSSIASVIYLIVVVLQKLISGINVPGYATIVVLILFLGGIQLFSLGIIGEYLSKMYVQVKNRPIYILKKHLDRDKTNEVRTD